MLFRSTTGKTIALTRWTFVGKVMSLLLNMLSRFVITFLLRSKPRPRELRAFFSCMAWISAYSKVMKPLFRWVLPSSCSRRLARSGTPSRHSRGIDTPVAITRGQSGGAPALRPGAIAQSPGREAALAWASLAQRFPASSVLAREVTLRS